MSPSHLGVGVRSGGSQAALPPQLQLVPLNDDEAEDGTGGDARHGAQAERHVGEPQDHAADLHAAVHDDHVDGDDLAIERGLGAVHDQHHPDAAYDGYRKDDHEDDGRGAEPSGVLDGVGDRDERRAERERRVGQAVGVEVGVGLLVRAELARGQAVEQVGRPSDDE